VVTSLALTVAVLTKALPCRSPNDVHEVHAMAGNSAMTDGLILQIRDKKQAVCSSTDPAVGSSGAQASDRQNN